MADAKWWAPTGTPYPFDKDGDGVPITITPEGVTRWELTSIDPGFLEPLPPPRRLTDLEDD